MSTEKHSRTQSRVASIEDVARAAGVSTATVSRVLNSPRLVAPDTAERVRAAVASLGYKPNLFAKGLMTRRSRVLCIALPDIHGEFYSELLRGADDEARRQKYQLLVTSEARKGEQPAEGDGGLDLAFGIAEGVALMIAEPNAELLRATLGTGLPVVVVDAEVDRAGVDSIVIDNVVGTVEATAHLLAQLPMDRLYFVGGPENNFDTRTRAQAFVDTLRQSGHEPRPHQLAYREYTEAWGYEWAQRRHREGGLHGGVLCANDEIAMGVLQAAQDMGVDVPGTLRIIGFDDTRIASLVRPKLSTVRVPMGEVGASAVKLLVSRLEEPEAPSRTVRLPTRLVVRGSS